MYWLYDILTPAAAQQESDGPVAVIVLSVGSFIVNGELLVQRSLIADLEVGGFDVAGSELTKSYICDLDAGTFAVAGQEIAFVRSFSVTLDVGSFALTGAELTFIRSVGLEAGTFSVVGQDVSITRDVTIDLARGSFVVTPHDVEIIQLVTVVGLGTRWHNQVATYWPRGADDGYGGYSYGFRQAYAVRWEDRIEELQTRDGELIVSSAVVWVPVRLEEGGYLYLGQADTSDPTTLHDAHVIRKVVETPSLRGDSVEYRVYL